MNRRRYLRVGATTIASGLALAGCTNSSGSGKAPPRKSDVFDSISDSGQSIRVTFRKKIRVQSRADVSNDGNSENGGGDSNSLIPAPVGVAAAKGRGASGRGRSGSYGSAPHRNGYAIWHGGAYNTWHNDHDDEVQWYPATVAAAGISYLGSNSDYTNDAPGAGAVDWDRQWNSPNDSLTYNQSRSGWYRAGAKLKSKSGGHSFGWEAADFKLKPSGSVGNKWKISPRL